jgi:excisionase family DNA binding protein
MLAPQPRMTDTQETMDAATVDWAKCIPVGQIPCVLAFLSARLLAEGSSSRTCEHNSESARDTGNLLTAGELAERLNLPESWVRTEERAGRIPSVRLGRYVRFKLSDIERALAERGRQGE